MKSKILVGCFLLLSSYLSSQTKVDIAGYYINKYKKKEIEFKKKNEYLRKEGKSYETMIDYKVQSYYFTLKVDSTFKIIDDTNIAPIMGNESNYKNVEFYKFPPFSDFLNEFIEETTIKNQTQLTSCSNFYSLRTDSIHIYKIYYIEGSAIRVKVQNDYLNKEDYFDVIVNWNIIPPSKNKQIPSFFVYLIYNMNVVDCDRPPMGFFKWNCNGKE